MTINRRRFIFGGFAGGVAASSTALSKEPVSSAIASKLEQLASIRDFGVPASGTASAVRGLQDAAAAAKHLIVPAGRYLIDANLALDAHLQIQRGALFELAPGIAFTINGTIDAGEYQVFNFADSANVGPVRIAGLSEIRQRWFGIYADPLKNARVLQMLVDQYAGTEIVFSDTVTLGDTVTLRTRTNFRGHGKNGAGGFRLADGVNKDLFRLQEASANFRIKLRDLFFDGNSGKNEAGSGIVSGGSLHDSEFSGLWLVHFADYGIKVQFAGCSLDAVDVQYCNRGGVYVSGGAGLTIRGGVVENNRVHDYIIQNFKGFDLSGAYLEQNPTVNLAHAVANIDIVDSHAGSIRNCYFSNYGPLGIRCRGHSTHIDISNNFFWWAHGTPYSISETCVNVSARSNWVYNRPYGTDFGDGEIFERARIGRASERPAVYFPKREIQFNSFAAVDANGVSRYGKYAPGPFSEIERVGRNGGCGYATGSDGYFETAIAAPVERDVVVLMQTYAGHGSFGLFELDGALRRKIPSGKYQPETDIINYPPNKAAVKGYGQYLPAGSKAVKFRLYPNLTNGLAGDQYVTMQELLIVPSLLRNGCLSEAFSGGLAQFWSVKNSSGRAQAEEDTRKAVGTYLKEVPYGQLGDKPLRYRAPSAQAFSGSSEDLIYCQGAYRSAIPAIESSDYARIHYLIFIESGAVQAGVVDPAKGTMTGSLAQALSERGRWIRIDRIQRGLSSYCPAFGFKCTQPETKFFVYDLLVFPVMELPQLDRLKLSGVFVGSAKHTLHNGVREPDVSFGNYFLTANTEPTALTNFRGGADGQRITLVFGDGNTTVRFSGPYLRGNGGRDWNAKAGDHMDCICDGTLWYCGVHRNSRQEG